MYKRLATQEEETEEEKLQKYMRAKKNRLLTALEADFRLSVNREVAVEEARTLTLLGKKVQEDREVHPAQREEYRQKVIQNLKELWSEARELNSHKVTSVQRLQDKIIRLDQENLGLTETVEFFEQGKKLDVGEKLERLTQQIEWTREKISQQEQENDRALNKYKLLMKDKLIIINDIEKIKRNIKFVDKLTAKKLFLKDPKFSSINHHVEAARATIQKEGALGKEITDDLDSSLEALQKERMAMGNNIADWMMKCEELESELETLKTQNLRLDENRDLQKGRTKEQQEIEQIMNAMVFLNTYIDSKVRPEEEASPLTMSRLRMLKRLSTMRPKGLERSLYEEAINTFYNRFNSKLPEASLKISETYKNMRDKEKRLITTVDSLVEAFKEKHEELVEKEKLLDTSKRLRQAEKAHSRICLIQLQPKNMNICQIIQLL